MPKKSNLSKLSKHPPLKTNNINILTIQKSAKKNQKASILQKIYPLLLVILVMIVFSNTFNNDFINWDDDIYIKKNPYLELNAQNVKHFFTKPYFVMYIPLTMVSYMIDNAVAGKDNARLYHIHNVLLHLINTLLVYCFVLLLFKNMERRYLTAFFTAALFAVHPLHVESVTWIAERKDVLYAFFFLTSLISYTIYTVNNNKKYLTLTFLLYIFSLLSKTQAIVLPLVLLLIDYQKKDLFSSSAHLKTIFSDKQQISAILEKIPFFVLSILFAYIAIKANSEAGTTPSIYGHTKMALNTGYKGIEALVFMAYSFTHYFILLFVPFKQSGIHPYPYDAGQIPPLFYAYLLFPVLYLILLIYLWKKNKKVEFFSFGFFALTIFIVLKIKNFVISEHYEYLPSVGTSLFLANAASTLYLKNNKLKTIVASTGLAYLILLSVLTFKRNNVYQNSLTFWNDVSKKYPQVLVAYYNKANYLQEMADTTTDRNKAKKIYRQAIESYSQALRLNPDYTAALANRGITYAKTGQIFKAIKDFDKVIKLDSTQKDIFINRGNALALTGRWQKALADYNKAVKLNPSSVNAHYNRGIVLLNLQQYQQALDDFNFVLRTTDSKTEVRRYKAIAEYSMHNLKQSLDDLNIYLSHNPHDPIALYYKSLVLNELHSPNYRKFLNTLKHNTKIVTYLINSADVAESTADKNNHKHQYQKAIKMLNTVLTIDSTNTAAMVRLGIIYGKLNNIKKSIALFSDAIKIDNKNFDAYSNRGYAYLLDNQINKALNDFNKALQLSPGAPTVLYNRSILYEKTGQIKKALADISKAIENQASDGLFWLRSGILKLKIKDKTACSDFKKALQLGQKSASSYLKKYCK